MTPPQLQFIAISAICALELEGLAIDAGGPAIEDLDIAFFKITSRDRSRQLSSSDLEAVEPLFQRLQLYS